MQSKRLVLDANILIRAVLGRRVRQLIETYAEKASFFVAETAYWEAEEYVPLLITRHGGDPRKALAYLRSLPGIVQFIGADIYGSFEAEARERLGT